MIYNKDTIISFGKYKGRKLEEIINVDFSYIIWCMKKCNQF